MQQHDELCEELFELEVVVEVTLPLSFRREQQFKFLVENDVNKVVHEVGVEADLGLHFVGHSQKLVIENLNVTVRVISEVLENTMGAHQVMLEELRER